jgi:hypothetical protein
MYLDVSQIRFICNKEFEPVRYERLNKMIDTLGLNRDIIRFHSPTYKHTITDEQFNTHVRSSLEEKLHWVGRKYQRRSELSLVLNYLYNLEEIEKEFEDGIFIIFESDVDVKDNFKELPKLIEVLKQNAGKWDLVHFGQNGHNGEEDKKGNALTLKTFDLLKKLPIQFIGNIEGRDLYGSGRDVDVVVCDGFIGNIILKATEGLAKSIFHILKDNIAESSIAKTGALLLKPTLKAMKKRLDYAEYGGAALLGVNGTCIIGHGSSTALAVKNAVRVVIECARNDVNVRISENILKYKI